MTSGASACGSTPGSRATLSLDVARAGLSQLTLLLLARALVAIHASPEPAGINPHDLHQF